MLELEESAALVQPSPPVGAMSGSTCASLKSSSSGHCSACGPQHGPSTPLAASSTALTGHNDGPCASASAFVLLLIDYKAFPAFHSSLVSCIFLYLCLTKVCILLGAAYVRIAGSVCNCIFFVFLMLLLTYVYAQCVYGLPHFPM